jgi:methyl acetate hydrolase
MEEQGAAGKFLLPYPPSSSDGDNDNPPVSAETARGSRNQIDNVLRETVEEKKIPGIVAMVAVADRVRYQGAAGKRDTSRNIPMTVDSIFRIASMVKPITSVAVMQLVEAGRVKLDEPAATYLPALSRIEVLEEFDAKTGRAKLRAPHSPLTIRHLLSHTSGFAYESFDRKLHDYLASGAVPSIQQVDDGFLNAPLVFDPGSRWEYGISADWLGKLVEKISGQTLADYFREHIFQPLGMSDTFYDVPGDKQARVVVPHQHQQDGSFREIPPQPFQPVRFYSGGGGLFSTAGDYLKFEQMLLGGGKLGGQRILDSRTVDEMSRNQIGELTVVALPSLIPQVAKDPVRIPGSIDKFGLGFGINTKPVTGGRARGSLAWAGIYNTFFWIDPTRRICAVLMMQTLPFGDDLTTSVVKQFEGAVYANFRADQTGAIMSASARGCEQFNVLSENMLFRCILWPSTLSQWTRN